MSKEQQFQPLPENEARTETELIKRLEEQFNTLPDEAFSRLQYLQPQIGCFNRCSFCSQSAGKEIWQFSAQSLKTLVEAIARAATSKFPERAEQNLPLIAFDRSEHKPGIVYPYLDNDIGSYLYLNVFIELLAQKLNVKTRISTVGYSRKNTHLQKMHEQIARDLAHHLDGIRFSFTPYTYGFTSAGDTSGDTSREEYIQDFGNMLRTYRPYIESRGIGRNRACVEVRFKPAIFLEDDGVVETTIDGHQIIKSGAYAVVCDEPIQTTYVTDINGRTPVFDKQPVRAKLLQSDALRAPNWKTIIADILREETDLNTNNITISLVDAYKLENIDGPYYVLNPHFGDTGHYSAIQIYPRTEKRKAGGVMDSTRFFLNTILDYKQSQGLARRDKFVSATWEDVQSILDILLQKARQLLLVNRELGQHILNDVYPMIEAYAKALFIADYPPHLFFDRDFTVDTGQIVNQGRALHEFKGLASTEDLPITANEEKGYGEQSFSTQRGLVWRWSPSPHASERITRASLGRKNTANKIGNRIMVSQLDWHNLMPFTPEGHPLPQIEVEGVMLEKLELNSATELALYPGVVEGGNDVKRDNLQR